MRDKELIKSSGIIGISQFLVMFLSLLKNKCFSILLGVDGIGLFGLFQSLLELVRSITSLGIHTAGIRYIASEEQSDDDLSQSRTIYVFRRWISFTGVLGAIVCFLFAAPLCIYTFGNDIYLVDIRILSIAIFFTALSAGQSSLLLALKKITVYAKSNITASLITVIITVMMAYAWGIKAVMPIFLITSVILWATGRFFINALGIKQSKQSFKEVMRKGSPILSLGLVTIVTGIATSSVAMFLKIMITQRSGLDEAGVFQAVWIIANSYLSIALSSLGTDLYPRLSAVCHDKSGFEHILNNYLRNGLVLISPLLILFTVFATAAISLLYASEFAGGVMLLRWLMAAFFFRAISMMLSYGLLAKAKKKTYIIIETIWYIPFVAICWFGYPRIGLDAIGIASLVSYFIYFIILYFELSISGYRIEKDIYKLAIINALSLAGLFLILYFYVGIGGIVISLVVMLPAFCLSLSDLNKTYPLRKMLIEILINIF